MVLRIFDSFLAGHGIKAIATNLTNDAIPSPSASDPARNRHRASSRGAWGQSAVRAILKNPRYTGYEVWARQRKDEVLLDIDDVAAGHVTKQRWNDADKWEWSRQPAHPAIISLEHWQAAQDVFTAGTRRSKPQRRRSREYMLKGMITCNACGRKLVANTVRGQLHYRCRMKDEYPGIDHPRSLSIREYHLLPTIDRWLAQLFEPDQIDDTIRSLVDTQADEIASAEELAVRRSLKDCAQRIANLETACESTNDPETIIGLTQRIERIRAERKALEIRLRRRTTGQGMTEAEIRNVVSNLADAITLLSEATPEDRRRVYEAAQLEVLYDHENRRAQLSVAPRVTGGVGGASCTLTPHTESEWVHLRNAP